MMEKARVGVKKMRENARLPIYGSEFSAGADLYFCAEEPLKIMPGTSATLPTGIALELPFGTVGLVYARSGMATKRGLAPANKVGVIDSDYRGELLVVLYNQSDKPQVVEPGERIAQLIVTPYIPAVFEERERLSETERGTGGFGSTGRT